MNTPNEKLINNLTIKAGVMEMGEKIAWGSDTALMRQAAATLQSQAERIKELERESETHAKAYGLAIVERDNLRHELKTAQEGWRCECSTDDACRFARERDALRAELGDLPEAQAEMLAEIKRLRAQLAEIEKTEPYAYEFGNSLWHADNQRITSAEKMGKPLFTRPMPAQDVTELVEALQLFADALPLERSTIKTCYAVTDQMRDAAHAALSKYKGAK